eukprot:6388972-Amphidinium_carterae.1
MDSLTATINPLTHDQHLSSIQSKPQQDNQRKHSSNLNFAREKETSTEQHCKLPFQDFHPLSKCRTDMLASSPLQGVATTIDSRTTTDGHEQWWEVSTPQRNPKF